MKIQLITQPSIEPISEEELQLHLKMDDDAFSLEYGSLGDLISTARGYVEDITKRALLTQTYDYFLNEFPSKNYIKLPFGNLQSITRITYKESDWNGTNEPVTSLT